MEPTQFFPPGHFYSPIPSESDYARAREAWESDPTNVPGVDMNVENQWALLRELVPYLSPERFTDEPTTGQRFHCVNPSFGHGDALTYQAMLRHLRPRRVIEIGSGHSSCLLLDVNDAYFNGQIDCTFIEPYPELLYRLVGADGLSGRLIPSLVQDVPLSVFDTLGDNDVLFIDSSHVAKAGSDVCHLLFRVLPRLAPGVAIHIHDIFWAFEYPHDWMREGRAWNEAYLLRAFLQYNSAFAVSLFPNLLFRLDVAWFQQNAPMFLANSGGSIWLRKVA